MRKDKFWWEARILQILSETITLGLWASLLAGSATGLGTIPVLFNRDFSRKDLDVMLGFAGGVMLAASAFSLLVPALEHPLGGVWVVSIGFIVGGLFVHLVDRYVPHEHLMKGPEGPSSTMSRTWLLVIAITIHNFPEGLAVGVAFGSESVGTGMAIAIAIGLQNIPEGLAVAAPLVRQGYSRTKAVGIGLLTGLVEPLGGVVGVSVVTIAQFLLPYGLAFAAGAMIFVVSDEMIPESHSGGFERYATMGLMIGFLVMMILDNIFG
ncbi:MAG: ZIP family metal transporter [Candidatus Thorarchaeota archaeon]